MRISAQESKPLAPNQLMFGSKTVSLDVAQRSGGGGGGGGGVGGERQEEQILVQINVLPGPTSSNSYDDDENADVIIQRLEALATNIFQTESLHQLYVAKGIKQVQRHSAVFIHKDPAEMTLHALQDAVRELKARLSGALAMEAALAAAHSELAVLRSSASVPQQITDLRAALADAGAKLARIALTPSQGDMPQELLALPAPEGVCVAGGRTGADWSAHGQTEDDTEWEEMQIVWESEENDLQHVTSIRITRDISVSQLCHRLIVAAADGAPGTVCCPPPPPLCVCACVCLCVCVCVYC